MKNHQIKVCQVVHGIVGGGSEQVILNYCSRMPDIHFDLLYQYEPNQQILERFNEAHINCIRIPDKVHHPIGYLLAMYRRFKNGHYDVIHSHLDWYMNVTATFCAWLAGVPKRVAHHHQAYHLTNPLLKLLCAVLRIPNKIFATHWLACGKAAAINGWGQRAVEQGKVTILPNAIDPDRFKFDAQVRKKIREQYGIVENELVVGHVGRFFPQKNHAFLIDVFAELAKIHPDCKLLLLGDGPLQASIQSKADKLGLSSKIVFACLQKDPAPFYSAMDVFCFPSLWEGLPLTLVEAQYNGLPIVASDQIADETKISNSFFKLSLKKSSDWINCIQSLHHLRGVSVNIEKFNIDRCYKQLAMIYH